jgi:hypothetical protein
MFTNLDSGEDKGTERIEKEEGDKQKTEEGKRRRRHRKRRKEGRGDKERKEGV